MINDVLAANLKRIRTARGLSQISLARQIGIDRKTIIYCEMGQRNPTLNMLEDIAAALQVSVIDLLKEE